MSQNEIIQKLKKGDIRSVARLLTLIENEDKEAENILKKIWKFTGKSYILGITLYGAIIWGGWGTMITSWETLEIEGAGAFEVPIYPVRTIIIVFSIICALVYMQLLYFTVTGKITPKKG